MSQLLYRSQVDCLTSYSMVCISAKTVNLCKCQLVQGWVCQILRDHLTELGKQHNCCPEERTAKTLLSTPSQEAQCISSCPENIPFSHCRKCALVHFYLQDQTAANGTLWTHLNEGPIHHHGKLLLTQNIQATTSLSSCHHRSATGSSPPEPTSHRQFVSRRYPVTQPSQPISLASCPVCVIVVSVVYCLLSDALYVVMYCLMLHTDTKPKTIPVSTIHRQ